MDSGKKGRSGMPTNMYNANAPVVRRNPHDVMAEYHVAAEMEVSPAQMVPQVPLPQAQANARRPGRLPTPEQLLAAEIGVEELSTSPTRKELDAEEKKKDKSQEAKNVPYNSFQPKPHDDNDRGNSGSGVLV